MKVILDLLRALSLSLLLFIMFMIKFLKSFFSWAAMGMDRLMMVGEKGLDFEIVKVKTLIKKIIKENYQKMSS